MKRNTLWFGLAITVGAAAACNGASTESDSTSSDAVKACDVTVTHTKPLKASCSECAALVCDQDSYCCSKKWNQRCVTEAAEWCGGGTGGSTPTGTGGSGGSTHTHTGSGGTGGGTTTTTTHPTPPPPGTVPTMPSPSMAAIQVDNLEVGVFGDVRPANPNDTASYPDAVIQGIFSGLQALNVPVTVDVGDHCFQSSTSAGGPCHDQFVNHFMPARQNYAGKLLPTLGNHEACGTSAATTGNCTSWTSGLIKDYLTDIVQPSTGQGSPFYSVVLYGSWGTAKFIHVAANAWTSAQQTWLQSSLKVQTNYTFVVRHEPFNDTRAPGVTPSEALYKTAFQGGGLTMSLTGHSHFIQLPGGTLPYGDKYGATQPYEVIIGNGGAPLDAGPAYGYATLTRRASDGAIVMQAYQVMDKSGNSLNNSKDTNYLFAVNADGSSNSDTSLP